MLISLDELSSLPSKEIFAKYNIDKDQLYYLRKKNNISVRKTYLEEDILSLTLEEASIKYKVHKSTIQHERSKLRKKYPGISFTNPPHEIYCDEDTFKCIDTEGKAWLLGWVATDGHAGERQLCWSLSKKDEEVLLKFKEILKFQGDVKYLKIGKFDIARLTIGGRGLCDSLSNYGMQGNKTSTVDFPPIREDLKRHFIRGCFEGDGNINEWTFSISGVSPLVYSIADEVKKSTGVELVKYTRKALKLIRGNKPDWDFMKWIYNDATYVLDRKYSKYLEMSAKLK